MNQYIYQISILCLLLSTLSICRPQEYVLSEYLEESSEEYEEHEIGEGVRCRDTEDLLKHHSEDVILCAKKILNRRPQLRRDSNIIITDLGGVDIIEYQKVTSIQWPYYPRDYEQEEDDIVPFRWFHNVQIIVPKNDQVSETAFLQIGGRFQEENNDPQNNQEIGPFGQRLQGDPQHLTEEQKFFIQAAKDLNAVVVILNNIPNQPIQINGQPATEDSIMAYTWRKFVENPQKYVYHTLQIPMSVATRAIMTFVKRQIRWRYRSNYDIKVRNFMVSGYSKRGWAAWLTSLIDKRVSSIVPIVIDFFNIQSQMKEIYQHYGNKWPFASFDYNFYGLTNFQNFSPQHHENFDLLLRIIDVHNYRSIEKYKQRLEIPKYLIMSSGDDFFVPQASQKFFKFIPGNSNFQYFVENQTHGIEETVIVPAIKAFFKMTTSQNKNYPYFDFETHYLQDKLQFQATYIVPQEQSVIPQDPIVKLWVAENQVARDFRFSCMQVFQGIQISLGQPPGLNGIYLEQPTNINQINPNTYQITASLDKLEFGWQSAFLQVIDQNGFVVSTFAYIQEGNTVRPYSSMPQIPNNQDTQWCLLWETNLQFK